MGTQPRWVHTPDEGEDEELVFEGYEGRGMGMGRGMGEGLTDHD